MTTGFSSIILSYSTFGSTTSITASETFKEVATTASTLVSFATFNDSWIDFWDSRLAF